MSAMVGDVGSAQERVFHLLLLSVTRSSSHTRRRTEEEDEQCYVFRRRTPRRLYWLLHSETGTGTPTRRSTRGTIQIGRDVLELTSTLGTNATTRGIRSTSPTSSTCPAGRRGLTNRLAPRTPLTTIDRATAAAHLHARARRGLLERDTHDTR